MKEVKIQQEVASYASLEDLLDSESYIGFKNETGLKYMIVTSGSCKGCVVRPSGTYSDEDDFEPSDGRIFVFDSANELLDWMKG